MSGAAGGVGRLTPNAALPWLVRAGSPGRSCCGSCNRRTAPWARPGEGCLAANRDGFLVRLAKSETRRPGRQRAVTVPGAREPLPPEAGHLRSLASPRFSQVVIGRDGGPAILVAPDPGPLRLISFGGAGRRTGTPPLEAGTAARPWPWPAWSCATCPNTIFLPRNWTCFPGIWGGRPKEAAKSRTSTRGWKTISLSGTGLRPVRHTGWKPVPF